MQSDIRIPRIHSIAGAESRHAALIDAPEAVSYWLQTGTERFHRARGA
jgi:hypothetical protein